MENFASSSSFQAQNLCFVAILQRLLFFRAPFSVARNLWFLRNSDRWKWKILFQDQYSSFSFSFRITLF